MRVIVADDSMLTRVGIVTLLEDDGIDVVAQCGDGQQTVDAALEFRPDVAIIDIRMPPTHTTEGLDAARMIRQQQASTAVLVLSHHLETSYALELIEAYPERVGYLLKDRVVEGAILIDALRRLSAGECVVDPSIVAELMRRRRATNPLDVLTEREREVLGQVAEGRSNAGIANRLHITERTVESHTTQIFVKLGLEDERQLNRRVLAVLLHLGR